VKVATRLHLVLRLVMGGTIDVLPQCVFWPAQGQIYLFKSCPRFQYGCCARIPSTVEVNLWCEIALRCTIEERNNMCALRAVNTTIHILFYCFHFRLLVKFSHLLNIIVY